MFQKLNLKPTIIFLSIFCICKSLYSQYPSLNIVTMTPDTDIPGKDFGNLKWHQVLDIPDATYYDVKRAFHKEWYSKPYEKHQMIKQYFRWEKAVEGNYNDSGHVIPLTDRINKHKSKTKSTTNSNWEVVGPVSPPPQFNNHGIGRVQNISFSYQDQNKYYVSTPGGGVWRTLDDGDNWTPVGDYLPSTRIRALAVSSQNDNILFCGLSTMVYKSIDSGSTWSQVFDNSYFIYHIEIDPNNHNTILIGTSNGIYKSSDQGLNWNLVPNTQNSSPTSSLYGDIKFKPNNSNVIYAASRNAVFKSIDGGDSFNQLIISGIDSDIDNIKLGVAESFPSVVFVFAGLFGDQLTRFNGLYKSLDEGSSFSKIADGNSPWTYLSGTTFSHQAGILGQDNPFSQLTRDWSLAINPNNIDEIFIGCIRMYRSQDGGANWNIMSNGPNGFSGSVHVDMAQIAYNPIVKTPYVGCDGGVYKYVDDNSEWERKNNGLGITQIYDIAISHENPESYILGCQDNGVMTHTAETGWNFSLVGDGEGVFADPVDPSVFYAGTNNSFQASQKSDGNGIFGTWDVLLNTSTSGETAESWAPDVWVHPFLRHVIYVPHNNLWRSTDAGESIVNISGNEFSSTTYATAQSVFNPNYIYMSSNRSSLGGMRLSTDGGYNWSSITWPGPAFTTTGESRINNIDINSNNEEHVFASTSAGVFQSFDAGTTWADITGNLSSFPRKVLFQKASFRDLYVATDDGVYHSDQTGVWELYDQNLPNVSIRDIEINYKTDEIFAATYGRGIWKSPLQANAYFCSFSSVPQFNYSGTIESCENTFTIEIQNSIPSGFTVEWYNEDQLITGETSSSLTVSQNGKYAARFKGSCFTYSSDLLDVIIGECKSILNYSEGFEATHDFASEDTSDLIWIQNSGATGSGGTGPSMAFEGNSYMYVEASNPNYPDKIALLKSPQFLVNAYVHPAMKFNYHMFGSDMGILNVFVSENQTNWTNILSINGNQGDQWQEASIDLSTYMGKSISFLFQGITGSNFTSDIAIDNFRFEENTSNSCVNILFPANLSEVFDNNCLDVSNEIVWYFDWVECPGATEYNVFVKSKTALNPSINLYGITNSEYTDYNTSGYISNQFTSDWYVKVRAKVNGVWGDWSLSHYFSIEPLNTDCPNCPNEYNLTGVQVNDFNFDTDGIIESNEIISVLGKVQYNSGISIHLNPDFEVKQGSVFHAFIEGCRE